jgi:competence ComEA-like helix-hairpin-helix protein
MNRPFPTQKPSLATPESDERSASGPSIMPQPRGEVFEPPASFNDMKLLGDDKTKAKGWLFLAGAFAFCLLVLGGTLATKVRKPVPIGPFTAQGSVPNNGQSGAQGMLKVQVSGQVAHPGVYDLTAGSRVQDALQKAGGALPDADLSGLNLASWVADGAKLDVPPRQGTPVLAAPLPAGVLMPSTPTTGFTALAPTSAVPAAPDTPPTGPPPTSDPSGSKTDPAYLEHLRRNPIHLNRASATELQALPGVGPKMAERIVAYRQQNGGFKDVLELNNVQDIGEKRMDVLRNLVTIQ